MLFLGNICSGDSYQISGLKVSFLRELASRYSPGELITAAELLRCTEGFPSMFSEEDRFDIIKSTGVFEELDLISFRVRKELDLSHYLEDTRTYGITLQTKELFELLDALLEE